MSPTNNSCIKLQNDLRENGAEFLQQNWTPEGGLSQEVYPAAKVRKILTIDTLRQLVECSCENLGCCSFLSGQHDLNKTVDALHATFTSVTAFFLMQSRPNLIFRAIEEGYTDTRLSAEPLSAEEIAALFHEEVKQGVVERMLNAQPQFFLSKLSKEIPHHVLEPRRILPISIEEQIGNGGNGVVYRARLLPGYHDFEDDGMDGRVAIKKLSHWSNDHTHAQTEAVNTVYFENPYIAKLKTSIQHGDKYLLVYPLARCDLKKFLTKPPEKSAGFEATIWQQYLDILCGLEYMHRPRGNDKVVGYHFDVKPHNILVLTNGDWVLTDFGQSHLKRTKDAVSKTSATAHLLTEEYKAPGLACRSSDVWAMGCIACELYTWFKHGPEGVEKFRKNREEKTGRVTLANFHKLDALQMVCLKDAVTDLFDEMEKDNQKGLAHVLRNMMKVDENNRLSSNDAGTQLASALDLNFNVLPTPPEDVIDNALKTADQRPVIEMSKLRPDDGIAAGPKIVVTDHS